LGPKVTQCRVVASDLAAATGDENGFPEEVGE